jgi:hypothetical protein
VSVMLNRNGSFQIPEIEQARGRASSSSKVRLLLVATHIKGQK